MLPCSLSNMALKKSLGVVAALVLTVLAASRTSPPSGSITVCSSGCNYNTVCLSIAYDLS